MTHRMAVEEFLYRKNLVPARDRGPRISQDELERQVNRFLAAGGKIQHVPAGQSGEVIIAQPKCERSKDAKILRRTIGILEICRRTGLTQKQAKEAVIAEGVAHELYRNQMRFDPAVVDAWVAKQPIKAG